MFKLIEILIAFVEMNFSTEMAMSLPYYHGVLSTSATSTRLRSRGHGYWLLRMSDVVEGEYVLSYVNKQGLVVHLIIPQTKKNAVIGQNQQLRTLEEIVTFVVETHTHRDDLLFQLNSVECQDDPVDPERFYPDLTCFACAETLPSIREAFKNNW